MSKRWPIAHSALTKNDGIQGVYELFAKYPGEPWYSRGLFNVFCSATKCADRFRRMGARVRIVFATALVVSEKKALKRKKP